MQGRYVHTSWEAKDAIEMTGGRMFYDVGAYKQRNHFPCVVDFPKRTIRDECSLLLTDFPSSLPRRKTFVRYTLPNRLILVEPRYEPGYLYLLSTEKQKEFAMADKEDLQGFPQVSYHGSVKEMLIPGHAYKYSESRLFVSGFGAGNLDYTPIFIRFLFDPEQQRMEAYSILRTQMSSQSWLLERTNQEILPTKKYYQETSLYYDLKATYGINWREEIGLQGWQYVTHSEK